MATPGEALNHIGQSFVILFKEGEIGGFLNELLKGAPIVGVFLIIYILGRFISAKTIFRGAESKTYENMFGVGLGLIGLFTPKVYAFMTNMLGGTFILVMAFIFIVSAIIIQITRAKGDAAKASAETNEALAESNKAKKESSKAKHDRKMSQRLDRKEAWAYRWSQAEVNDLTGMDRNLKVSLRKIRETLRSLSGMGDSEEAQQAKSRITTQLSTVKTTLKKEFKEVKKLTGITKRLKKVVLKDRHVDTDQNKIKNDLKKMIKEHVEHHTGKNSHEIESHLQNHIHRVDQVIENKLVPLDKKRLSLVEKAKQYDGMERTDVQEIEKLVDEMLSALQQSNIDEAISHIDKILKQIDTIDSINSHISSILKEEKQLDEQRKQAEHQINSVINDIIKEIKGDNTSSNPPLGNIQANK